MEAAHVRQVERIIGHKFSSDFLSQALVAAGAEQCGHDGNRKLSQLGASLVDVLVAIMVYDSSATKESIANLRQQFAKKDHYVAAAKRTGIDRCIKYDQRPGAESPVVLRKALNAIIAAVFLDTRDIMLTMHVTLR